MDEYALYVLNNIKNAKCGNILKISDKIIEGKSIDSFISSLYNVMDKSNIEPMDCVEIFKIVNSAKSRLNNCNKAGEQMIIDRMITSIWRLLHKEENV